MLSDSPQLQAAADMPRPDPVSVIALMFFLHSWLRCKVEESPCAGCAAGKEPLLE